MPSSVRRHTPTHADGRPVKITFGEMREMGVNGILVYCVNRPCSHSVALSADSWPDELRLSDLEPRMVCSACGYRGAEVRPDFNRGKRPSRAMGFRNTGA